MDGKKIYEKNELSSNNFSAKSFNTLKRALKMTRGKKLLLLLLLLFCFRV
jgi:hypothetical protein